MEDGQNGQNGQSHHSPAVKDLCLLDQEVARNQSQLILASLVQDQPQTLEAPQYHLVVSVVVLFGHARSLFIIFFKI